MVNCNGSNCFQAASQLYWQRKWCVRSLVNVMMTSTFVSGPTVHCGHTLQLSPLVNDGILLYRASLAARFSQGWQSFVLLMETCLVAPMFGSTLKQLLLTTGTGLTALHLQVCSEHIHS